MSTASIKDSHLTFNGKQYFRGGAEDILLGSYGEKKTPLLKINYLEVQGRLPADKLKIREAVRTDIDFSKETSVSVSQLVSASGVIEGVPVSATVDAKATVAGLRSGSLTLLKLVVENEDVRSIITGEHFERLKNYGNDARIVNQVFAVVSATLVDKLTRSGSLSVSASADFKGVKLTASPSVSGSITKETSVTLSAGSTFAYGLLSLSWNAALPKKRTVIEKLTDDQWGLN